MGTTPEQPVLDSLHTRFVSAEVATVSEEEQSTWAACLHEHLGVLHSSAYIPGGARLSEDSGGKFATGLSAQHSQKRP